MKLWEVLKALDENPKKVFESNLAGLEYKISLDGEIIAFESGAVKFIGLNNCRDWQEVKQPVTWQEAIEAWTNGKTIRCEDGGFDYLFSGGKSILTDSVGPIDTYQITKGTWYIED